MSLANTNVRASEPVVPVATRTWSSANDSVAPPVQPSPSAKNSIVTDDAVCAIPRSDGSAPKS
jgi:hypothetical protein